MSARPAARNDAGSSPRKTKAHQAAAPGRREILRALNKERNELRKKMMLIGYITQRVSGKGGSVFLVGGQAVETYTAGQFVTGDIDITTTDPKETEKILSALGFTKQGVVWLNKKIGVAVHIVGDYPTRTERARTIEVESFHVEVIGIEDLIIDRLSAAKFWKSQRDAEQADVLFLAFKDGLDLAYLKKRATDANVVEMLDWN